MAPKTKTTNLTGPLSNMIRVNLARTPIPLYLIISGFALAIDVGSGWIARQLLGFDIPIASVTGYCIGLIVAFPLLRRFAFLPGKLGIVPISGLYVLSAFLGLGATWIVSTLAVLAFQQDFFAAKASAAVVSFVSVYIFRRFVVFR